ncbi:glycosyltransferase [Desulfocurvus vexinensis]|uniref:glycosyltransferase n=1 Tax=Desulfocurvus vexinensis TaxID=399548 RepID=UPI00048F0A49|nr:glycosyltransferase [Desulfocurvus vexinensis]
MSAAPAPGLPLRVAYLFGHDHFMGGGERSTAELIRALDPELVRPLVLVPGPGELREHFAAAGVDTALAALPTLRAPLSPAPWRAVGALARLLRRQGVAVVHAGTPRAALYAGLAGRLAGVPVVWHVRESLRDLPWYDALLAGLASRVVCVSAAVREARVRPLGAWAAARAVVIHNGVDTAALRPDPHARTALRVQLGLGPDAVLVGLVGNVIARKGHDVCLEALALALEAAPGLPVRLLLAGRQEPEPQFAARVRALAAAPELAGRVLVMPFTTDVRALYSALDALVLPTRSEGFSRALIEAMSMGLPVAASDLPEVREALPGPEHALLAPPGDAQALAAHLLTLGRDAALRARLGAAGRARAEAHFDLHGHARAVQDEYFRLLAGRGRTLRRAAKGAWLGARGLLVRAAPRTRRPLGPGPVLLLAPPRLGDAALALGVPALLVGAGRRVEVLGRGPALDVLALSPHVAAVHGCGPGPGGLLRAARGLRGAGFGAVLDLDLDWRLWSALAARATGAPCAGCAVAGRAPLYDLALPCPGEEPIGDVYARLARALAGPQTPAPGGPLLAVPGAAQEAVARRLAAAGIGPDEPLVVLHPGATHPTQRWGEGAFAALAGALARRGAARVALAGGPGDAALVAGVLRAMAQAGDPPPALAATDLALPGLAALLARATVFVGNNSGPLHLAAALGRPTVSTLGPTVAARWTPQGPGHTVLRARGLGCLGCALAACPLGRAACMERIAPQAMLEAVLAALAWARTTEGGHDA